MTWIRRSGKHESKLLWKWIEREPSNSWRFILHFSSIASPFSAIEFAVKHSENSDAFHEEKISVVYTDLHERENASRDSGLVEYVYSSGHFVKTQLIAVCSFQRLKPFKWLCLDEQLKFQKLVHFFLWCVTINNLHQFCFIAKDIMRIMWHFRC